ncbi:RNA polymerase sigma-70 factor [Pedobacter frigidisoli]|uniref:RNA polymerase sigma factor n=1 Tax=Pedobacter frigidisoli TaxID=2530455 RepID=UPI00292F5741|nr:RNA polymerase sigma-70 factor [Pedobacter frigidisoli]
MASVNELSDNDLLLRLKNGEHTAFTEIYNRFWEKMMNYAVKLTKSEDEAADIVQEIFVSIWNRKESLEVKGPLGAYLIKSVRNLSLKYIEKNIHKENFMERLGYHFENTTAQTEDDISVKELQKNIDTAVSKLPGKMRQVYVLSRDEQLSHKEIAQKLGISELTVKKQINNALKLIAKSLKLNLSGAMLVLFAHLLK